MSEIKIQPNSIEAEQGLLSICLMDEGAYLMKARSAGILPEAFFKASHQTIYSALLSLLNDGRALDEILLLERLKAIGEDEKVGGLAAIYEIQGRAETPAHWKYFAGIVLGNWKKRQMIRLSREIAELAYTPGDSFDEVRASIQAPLTVLSNLSIEQAETNVMSEMEEIFDNKAAESRGEIKRTPDEFKVNFWMPSIEEKFGYVDSRSTDNNIVIGGPSSLGKSTYLRQGVNANIHYHPDWVIAYFIVEGSRFDYYHNSACAYAKIPNDVPLDEFQAEAAELGAVAMKAAAKAVAKYLSFRDVMRVALRDRLYLLENDMMIDDIVNRVREIKAKHGRMDLVAIDYQQVVGCTAKGVNREQQVSEVSGKIKRLQKEMGCAFLSGSQLNSDGGARESQAIYNDSTRFWRIGRPAKWQNSKGEEKTQALMGLKSYHQTIEQPKSRNGKTGWASYKLNAEMGRCEDYGAIPDGKRGRPRKPTVEGAEEF